MKAIIMIIIIGHTDPDSIAQRAEIRVYKYRYDMTFYLQLNMSNRAIFPKLCTPLNQKANPSC